LGDKWHLGDSNVVSVANIFSFVNIFGKISKYFKIFQNIIYSSFFGDRVFSDPYKNAKIALPGYT
jgi:hypothetical protein